MGWREDLSSVFTAIDSGEFEDLAEVHQSLVSLDADELAKLDTQARDYIISTGSMCTARAGRVEDAIEAQLSAARGW